MALIPPPSDDEAQKLGDAPHVTEENDAGADHDAEPAAMTLSAIGRGDGDGPLGVEGFGESDDAPGGSDLSKITQHSAFAIVVVAVVAAVVLGAMRMTGGSLGATTDAEVEAKIDQQLMNISAREQAGAGNPMPLDARALPTASMIRTLTSKDSPQVPIEYVQKNPFVFGLKKPEPKRGTPTQTPVDNSARIKEQIRREVGKLSIDMIMAGSAEKAVVINGDIYKVGDSISIFRVESIEAQQVFLRHGKYRVPLRSAN